MFRFFEAQTAAERMDELEAFLIYWYGKRRPEYGDSEDALNALPLSYPLRRFYAFAGQWPSPEPNSMEIFYEGGGGHHLRHLEYLEETEDGKLDFFMEYQGDWSALTLPDAEDPPVWLRGYFEGSEEDDEDEDGEEKTILVCDSLSKFLITHCLMTTLYESENALTYYEKDGPLVKFVTEELPNMPLYGGREPVKLWDTRDLHWPESCLKYEGEFYLAAGTILVHKSPIGKLPAYTFGTRRPNLPYAVFESLRGEKQAPET
jgi:hypothetical protein